MVIKKIEVLKYLILIILSSLFVIGLINTYMNSQLGLHSNKYRFWGIFCLTNLFFLLVYFVILDFLEKKKKILQRDRIIQRIRSFKIKALNVYKLPGIGFILEAILLFILLYISLLVPYEDLEHLFTMNSPFFIFFVILIIFGVVLMIMGFLFGGLKIIRERKLKDKDVSR